MFFVLWMVLNLKLAVGSLLSIGTNVTLMVDFVKGLRVKDDFLLWFVFKDLLNIRPFPCYLKDLSEPKFDVR